MTSFFFSGTPKGLIWYWKGNYNKISPRSWVRVGGHSSNDKIRSSAIKTDFFSNSEPAVGVWYLQQRTWEFSKAAKRIYASAEVKWEMRQVFVHTERLVPVLPTKAWRKERPIPALSEKYVQDYTFITVNLKKKSGSFCSLVIDRVL